MNANNLTDYKYITISIDMLLNTPLKTVYKQQNKKKFDSVKKITVSVKQGKKVAMKLIYNVKEVIVSLTLKKNPTYLLSNK